MKSPFPGMDPYLEKHWSDVHTRLMVLLCNQLQRQLPAELRATVEESVRIDNDDGEKAALYTSDVAVSAIKPWVGEFHASAPALAVAEPVVIPAGTTTERHIEIVSTKSGRSVVTVIEVLSPANKIGDRGRNQFLRKRGDYLKSGANYVEIDLLRGGQPLPPDEEAEQEYYKPKTYLVRVYRSYWRQWEVYPIALRDRLPGFRVPLRPSDTDVALDLQAAIDSSYEEGAYGRELDYAKPPEPTFEPDDASWLEQLIS